MTHANQPRIHLIFLDQYKNLVYYKTHYKPPGQQSDEQRPAVHAGYSQGSACLLYRLDITFYDAY